MSAPARSVIAAAGAKATPRDHLTVHFASGTSRVPLIDRKFLGAGERFAGPAVISQLDATTLVLPNWTAEVHASGAMILTTETGQRLQ
jgi:N-methylhydantoinase A